MTTGARISSMTNYIHPPGDHPEIGIPSSGIIVPQEICSATRHSRHDLPTIQFSYGAQSGINLLVAMRETHASLADYNTRPMTTTDEAASHINIRILWPGYAEYSSSTVIKESTRYGTVIPFAKWRLAMSIAKVIQEFYTVRTTQLRRSHI
ncbi:hypothetical protein BC629DRAFT_400309 [Irpex lacteus]|nr:hypothetical protein BC629DRAFT_400309 [Irpex lacteus]